jgi:hypothetical protein
MRQFILTLLGVAIWITAAMAAGPITFEWDASEQEVTGYRLFQRAVDGSYDYDHPVADIKGRETVRHVLTGVPDGTWCWVLRAYDEDNESGDSNEVSATVEPEDEKPRNIRFPK